MNIITVIVVGIVVVALVAAMAFMMVSSVRKAYEAQVSNLNERLGEALVAAETEREWVRNLEESKLAAEAEVKAIEASNRERELRYKHEQEVNYARIKELSERILGENARKLKEEGGENIARLLKPLQEEIGKFRQRIDEVNSEDARRAGALDERIKRLVEDTNQVSARANELASAIRGEAVVTGEWAEMQLKRIFELSGMKEGDDGYLYQETFASEGSDRKDKRIDFLVSLPEGRWIVVDSKATIEAYAEYHGLEAGEAKEDAKARIEQSVKAHVDEMIKADYARNLAIAQNRTVLPTMLMYIPFDEVYLIAMKARIKVRRNGQDVQMLLREYAREHDIAIVNGASVVPLINLIREMWINYNVDKKAAKIKETAESLVDKFNTFVNGFQELGKQLAKVNDQYNTSIRQLCAGPGNVMKRLGELKDLDVSAAAKMMEPEALEARTINGNA